MNKEADFTSSNNPKGMTYRLLSNHGFVMREVVLAEHEVGQWLAEMMEHYRWQDVACHRGATTVDFSEAIKR